MPPNVEFEDEDDFVCVGEVVAGTVPATKADAAVQTSSPKSDAFVDQASELRGVLSILTAQGEKRSTTEVGRMLVLESLYEALNAQIAGAGNTITGLGVRLREEAAFKTVQLNTIQASFDETALIASDNSSRLDRMVVKSLPMIESKLRASEVVREQQEAIVSTQIGELRRRLENFGTDEITEVRRLAAEANLRSLLLERRLPELKAGAVAAMAFETVAICEVAEENRKAVDCLGKGHFDMWEDIRQLTLRISRADRVVRHLSGTVVPLLEARIQEQAELIAIKEAELEMAKRLSIERELALLCRVEVLEAGLRKKYETAAEKEHLWNRLVAVESAVEHLKSLQLPVKKAQFVDHRSELIAEVARRERRRLCAPTAKALLAELVRRELLAEIRRRSENSPRRLVIKPQSLRGEILRRALVAEITRRRQRSIALSRSFPRGLLRMKCKTLTANISIDAVLPRFVSVAYLKQLIYFKTDCSLHPDRQTLVYAGKILQDDWKIGGGVFTSNGRKAEESTELSEECFKGISDCSTVLIVVRKD